MISKKQIREIRQRLDVTVRLTNAATHPDAGEELVIMTAAAHAALALDVVPMLLDEIEALQGSQKSPGAGFVKFDAHGGHA